MANNSIVPFVGSTSTFALEGEPTPVNQIVVADAMEHEAEHVATTPLAMLPAPTTKEGPVGASRGSADPLVRPHPEERPSGPRSALSSIKLSASMKGRGGRVSAAQRPTTGELRHKDIAKRLFANPLPPVPLEEGKRLVFSVTSKSGNVVSHNYTTDTYTPASPTPQPRFHVVGIRTPGGQYESDEDDKVLKGPKVAQLLRNIIEMRKEHKRLSDQVAELTLELKSVRDDYDTFCRGLCSKVNTLAKTIGKNDA
ncbi:hypothetical protein C2845_PM17G09460 [Panicum miliaceum]|uniref:Uncharacterized protein n=1 Tax=Panicum miliaceum TaxID=4540 RepID=A0A3L6Q764_PANMI|nr:hypothetical protein C2845_PM17G09460 [Panicum miliaceum]